MKPIIGITMGDPAGIGPEVIIRALTDPKLTTPYHPVLIGKTNVFRRIAEDLDLSIGLTSYKRFEDISFQQDSIAVLDTCDLSLEYTRGKTSQSCGNHSFLAVVEAVRLCQNSDLDAMVTAPICKESWHKAGHKFDGHTGLLAHLTSTSDYRMMFASSKFHVVLVTTHLPLKEVSSRLSESSILKTIELGALELKALGIEHPRIAVCGLNPHAGENRIFGDEDLDHIEPAVQEAKKRGINATGPFPADTIFIKALNGDYHMVIAQYHDQGLIPMKLLSFDSAVNVTIGLPIIRTSVDHGTAFDIAGKGIANHYNMNCAIEYAIKRCQTTTGH